MAFYSSQSTPFLAARTKPPNRRVHRFMLTYFLFFSFRMTAYEVVIA